ncbi:hypothetical protein CAS74_002940 [Pichia kudriavzevii]|uniref:Protein CWH43 n=1 Tax=Pichia kudriavzevii TaxID=4909 RepID=A0A099P3N8_PICKU|nr:hypothetical protein JL09_g1291 [Pichia kudriavzevii]OUT21956.1 hypothetical protein CAS74_002940 [Pichia kudriavzevii]
MVASSSVSRPLLRINAQFVAIAHTICSASAFIAAFVIGYALHFEKIVRNEYFGYPDEWFPSVSATIGDRYPERSVFQILIALTSGPRFLLLFFSYIRLYKPNSSFPKVALISGIIRTVTCGGWVYITSTDDHDWHDIFMISYIVLTLPWDISIIKLTSPGTTLKKYRKLTAYAFFGTLFPLIYLFVQHKIHHTPGSYSYYAYTEWLLIVFDILFDSWAILDFRDLYLEIRPTDLNDEFFSINFRVSPYSAGADAASSSNFSSKNYDHYGPEKSNFKLSDNFIPKNSEFNGSYIQIMINIVNAYMFWTIFTALFLCIWYFPLWYMGISGYELVIITSLSPILLKFKKLREFAYTYPNKIRFYACIFGVGSFMISDPMLRLFSISIGNALSFIGLTSEVALLGMTKSSTIIRSYATTFMLGLTLTSIGKFAYWTNNPVWPILNEKTGGLNKIGIVIGLLAAHYTQFPKALASKTKDYEDNVSTSWKYVALAFGSLMFSWMSMLTDSSVIITWVWDGYPISGPTPVPHGAVTLSVMLFGIYFGFYNPRSYKLITGLGIIGSVILYSFHGWLGYFGGMIYTFWLTYVSQICFEQLSGYYDNIAKVMFAALSVTTILVLMHVWVVAYAFVPGGPLLRERTDIVLGSSVLLIAMFVYGLKGIELNHIKVKKHISKFNNIIVSLLFLSGIIAFNRFQYSVPKPYHPKSRLVTAGIWTIHFGLDNDMWASEYRMRDLIRDAELDVVGLLESDTERIIMGNRDLTQRIAEELNMYADFGPGPNKHTWGAALLSKFPILNSTHHLLPSPVGELAPAIHATLDMYGTLVDVVVFHSGQEEDEEDRRLQSLELQRIMGSSDRPMILLSYLVTTPHEGNYHTYVSEESGMHDIDVTDDDRWCEYILYKKMKRTGYARISRGSITDTELQVGKFVVPFPDESDETYSQDAVPEVWMNVDRRFPDIFRGDGVRDHRYHVFEEPKYYI